ncbi:hypothetical protein CC80DRAFT_433639 [Byssothecium circinans]|uniref:Uncharacterized protein n=1 Tax=Byssothecium circinans TaxID=147558 RepID=A0A6A5UHG8_9PLEO|nr:hypothetical protein CC80DRAFT_433639 [Byssothecium circinans]
MASQLVDFEDDWWGWDGRPYQVGFWNNWSKDGAASLTLTLPSNASKVLLSLITLFIYIVGGCTWNIICFAAHQLLSTDKAKDGLYHQRQAVLRNSMSPSSSLWYFIKLGRFWRSNARRSWRRQLPFILINLLHILCFAVAAVMSVQVAYTGHAVLIRPTKCGIGQLVNGTDATSDITYRSKAAADIRKSMLLSMEYARNCYGEEAAVKTPQSCKFFRTTQLPYELEVEVPCPLRPRSLCRNSSAGTIRLQSEMLDSHTFFGINSRKKDRIEFGKAAVCTPLPYTEDPNYVEKGPAVTGPSIPEGLVNITFKYSIPPITFLRNESSGGFANVQPYYITVLPFSPEYPNVTSADGSTFKLINELRPSDADVSLALLHNQALYLNSTEDFLFGTRTFRDKDTCKCNNLPLGVTGSYLAQSFSPFVCLERTRFCNPAADRCTPWDAFNNLLHLNTSGVPHYNLMHDLGLNDRQKETVSLIGTVSALATFAQVLQSIGGSSLLAQDKLLESAGTMSLAVEPDQYRREIEHWFQIQLALLQRGFVERLYPPQVVDPFFIDNNEVHAVALCRAQMVHQAEYVSYSVLGLVLVLVLGLLMIAASLGLEPGVRWWRERREVGAYEQMEWDTGELLHLQRLAYEASGQGTWNDDYSSVPTTERDEMITFPLSLADGSNAAEPKLLSSRSVSDQQRREATSCYAGL